MSELQTSKTGTSRPEGWWVAGGGSLTLMTGNPAVGPGPFRLSLHLKLISGFLIVLGLAVTIGATRHMLDGEWMAGLSRSRGIPTPLLFLLGLFLMAAPWLISAQEQKSWGKLHSILSLDSDGVNVRTLGVSYRVPWQAIASFRVTSVRRRRRKVLSVELTAPAKNFLVGTARAPSAAPMIEPVVCFDPALEAEVLEFYRLNADQRSELGTDQATHRANRSRSEGSTA
ncbi:MAG: hypothetical protein ABWY04_00280 [Arthrobacter sp.]